MLNRKSVLLASLISVALSGPCRAGLVFDFNYTDFSGPYRLLVRSRPMRWEAVSRRL